MYSARITRSLIRIRASKVPRISTRLVSTHEPAPPIGPEPANKKNAGTPFIIGALAAAGGLGYYYYSKEEQKPAEVGQKARELEEAARAQTQRKVDEGKVKVNGAYAEGRAKVDHAQTEAKEAYNSAISKAENTAADTQARLNSYKDSAATSLHNAKESTERGLHDAKVYTEEKGQQAKSTWWSWLSWGSKKSEEAKGAAAEKVAQGAAGVKEKAADVENNARKQV